MTVKKDKKPKEYCSVNERIKFQYEKHLRRIGQKDDKTIIACLRHIRDFEIFIDFAGFEVFNDDVADKYIQTMFDVDLSMSYITDNIRSLKDFLNWLERQRGYRSKINYNHIEYLNISRNQRRTAKVSPYKKAYKYDQILQTVRQMPNATDKEKRDKAIISLQALCTLRVSELRTVTLQNLIEEDGVYFIDVFPKDMQVKFAKHRQAVFVSLGDDIQNNVLSWYVYLRSLDFKGNDPLFPVIDSRFTQGNLLQQSIRKDQIKSDTTIRNVFKKAFENAGLDYINPHSFRNTLARYAETQTPVFLNAVRQNLGHSSIDTTLSSYGRLSIAKQRKVISEVQLEPCITR